jgi:hypothetical protein
MFLLCTLAIVCDLLRCCFMAKKSSSGGPLTIGIGDLDKYSVGWNLTLIFGLALLSISVLKSRVAFLFCMKGELRLSLLVSIISEMSWLALVLLSSFFLDRVGLYDKLEKLSST